MTFDGRLLGGIGVLAAVVEDRQFCQSCWGARAHSIRHKPRRGEA